MKLFGFKYLHKQRPLILVLMLTIASTLFYVTALSFLGFKAKWNLEEGIKDSLKE